MGYIDAKGLSQYVLKTLIRERECTFGIVSIGELPRIIEALSTGNDILSAIGKTVYTFKIYGWVPDCYKLLDVKSKLYYDWTHVGAGESPLEVNVVVHYHVEDNYIWGFVVSTY
jgi:hypothetical protein